VYEEEQLPERICAHYDGHAEAEGVREDVHRCRGRRKPSRIATLSTMGVYEHVCLCVRMCLCVSMLHLKHSLASTTPTANCTPSPAANTTRVSHAYSSTSTHVHTCEYSVSAFRGSSAEDLSPRMLLYTHKYAMESHTQKGPRHLYWFITPLRTPLRCAHFLCVCVCMVCLSLLRWS
jgi:hypothetical protein